LVGDYGLAIIMLTVLVNIIMFPLTRKQLESSKKLQEIQPQLRKLQEKYKNDKEKYNQVTMEFMRENKVNPLGGCLPLLIQLPIMIAIFQLLRDPTIIVQIFFFFV
jgi:YidC/Oxa1 family membrane protein insertase